MSEHNPVIKRYGGNETAFGISRGEKMEKPPILNKEQLMKLAEKEREILDWQGKTVSDFITTKQRDADVEYYAQAVIAERKRLIEAVRGMPKLPSDDSEDAINGYEAFREATLELLEGRKSV